ncbi:MAG: hypothetical protein AAB849_01910 [Patescibacteria group bacterium]
MKINFNKNTLFLYFLSLAMIVITTLPYLWNYFERPNDADYTWIGVYNPVDVPGYYSYIEQVRQGHYTFIDLLTGEIQTQRFFNIFWLAVGLIAKGLNITPPIAFQLARILLIPLLVWTLKKTIDFFYPTKHWRYLLTASLFVSGPSALMVPEATPFASMFFSGHFLLSWILLLWSIMLIIDSFRRQSWYCAFGAGFINLLFFQFHPYYAPLIFLFVIASLVYNLIETPRLKILWLALPPLLLPLPALLYYFYLWVNDPRFYASAQLNQTLSPAWWITLFSFGLLGPLAIAGIVILLRDKQWQETHTYLFFWLIITWLLLYSPLSTQRRFMEGLIIPIGIFALIALIKIKNKITWRPCHYLPKNTARLIAGWLFLIFFCFSGLFIYFKSWQTNDWLYLPKSSSDAIDWIKKNGVSSDLFLSPDGQTNIIAALSGRQFYGWHWTETTYVSLKKKIVKSFLETASDAAKEHFLRQSKITKIYWNNAYNIKYSFRPEEKNYLTKIYDNGDVKIYAVN